MTSHAGRGAAAPVVVGYDGSPSSDLALDWAAREAARRGTALRVVTADHRHGLSASLGFGSGHHEPRLASAASAEHLVEARQRAGRHCDDEAIDTAVVLDRPAVALVGESARAGLLVVGHRGRGAITSALGSVSVTVAEHAHCPVVVVRGDTTRGSAGSAGGSDDAGAGAPADRPVVVGVDGAPLSRDAVGFAADTAVRWGVPLRVVCAWAILPQVPSDASGWQTLPMEQWNELAEALSASAQETAQEAAAQARTRYPELQVEAVSPELQPALALEDESRTGCLVVVGASGSGALEGLLLGSVSRAVLHHAACPVAVIRHEDGATLPSSPHPR